MKNIDVRLDVKADLFGDPSRDVHVARYDRAPRCIAKGVDRNSSVNQKWQDAGSCQKEHETGGNLSQLLRPRRVMAPSRQSAMVERMSLSRWRDYLKSVADGAANFVQAQGRRQEGLPNRELERAERRRGIECRSQRAQMLSSDSSTYLFLYPQTFSLLFDDQNVYGRLAVLPTMNSRSQRQSYRS